jgi:hypothetical protein
MEDRLAMSLHRERGPMILEDLRALPAAPLTVAEGTPITPTVVGSGRAVWLIPAPDLQRARLNERQLLPGVRELYERLGDGISAEVEEYEGSTVLVDSSSGLAETVARVEAHFADLIARGPVARSVTERRRMLRYANRAFVAQYLAFFTRPWARQLGDITKVVLPFSCECAQEGCEAQIELAVSAFPTPPDSASPPLLAPGHQAASAEDPGTYRVR